MKTTLTLDDDVVAIDQARTKSSADFSQLINDLLRAGLKEALSPKRPNARYRTPSTDAGDCLIGSIDDIEHVLSDFDYDLFVREVAARNSFHRSSSSFHRMWTWDQLENRY